MKYNSSDMGGGIDLSNNISGLVTKLILIYPLELLGCGQKGPKTMRR